MHFTTGPSSSSDQISVAVSPPADGANGAVTIAALGKAGVSALTGNCWYIWTTQGVSWYGELIDQQSCLATPIAAAPLGGTPSSTAIGWQQGSFPAD